MLFLVFSAIARVSAAPFDNYCEDNKTHSQLLNAGSDKKSGLDATQMGEVPFNQEPCIKINSNKAPLKFTLLHTNDIHAHLESFNAGGTSCKIADLKSNSCFGGVARIKTKVLEFRKSTKDVILVDAGDQFTGTLFFNTFGGYASSQAMNDIKYDVMTIGNHEFDKGIDHLTGFIKNLTFPVISSNVASSALQTVGVKPYVILSKYNLGIIGYITKTLPTIVTEEILKSIVVLDPIATVQQAVDELHAKGIKRIICVSHNGYIDDQELASKTSGINLIVGGHSHSLLHNNVTLGPEGPYPTKVRNLGQTDTYVVQAHRYGDYLGHVDLEWNQDDELISIIGEPILLDNTIVKEPVLQAQVEEWAKSFEAFTNDVITKATANYAMDCLSGECAMASLITDCLLSEQLDIGVQADVAFVNAGGIRSAFQAGDVTYADTISVLPFANSIVQFKWSGQQILDTLERVAAKKSREGVAVISTALWGGMRFAVQRDSGAQDFNRISKVLINGLPLDVNKSYSILTSDFVSNGGDGIMDKMPTVIETVMVDSVITCLRKRSTISPAIDGRVEIIE